MMRPADDYDEICDGLFFWQAHDPSVKTDLSSVALRVEAGLVFVDPIPLANTSLDMLLAQAKPAAIILTNANHERAAAQFRERFSIPVLAHATAGGEFSFAIDRSVADGDRVFGDLEIVELP